MQYRETNFNFISRLLEAEGISYHFEHSKDGHKLVLADDPSIYQDCPQPARGKVRWNSVVMKTPLPLGGWRRSCARANTRCVTFISARPSRRSGRSKSTSKAQNNVGNNSKLEMYDYCGGVCPAVQ